MYIYYCWGRHFFVWGYPARLGIFLQQSESFVYGDPRSRLKSEHHSKTLFLSQLNRHDSGSGGQAVSSVAVSQKLQDHLEAGWKPEK